MYKKPVQKSSLYIYTNQPSDIVPCCEDDCGERASVRLYACDIFM